MPQIFKRRIVREKVLQMLYAFEMNDSNEDLLFHELLSEVGDDADKEFARLLIKNVKKNQEKLDEFIKSKVSNWDLSRIALVDRILLRLGISEILFFPDIPPKVSINEYIEIAKDYSTSSSGKFINGILDAILADLKSGNKLNKKGRGLVEESLPKASEKK